MDKLCQKALQDAVFRFFLGKPQRLQLQQLIARDLADGGLMDKLGPVSYTHLADGIRY